MLKIDRSVARNFPYTKSGIGVRERHNERKNEYYTNPDIVLDRSQFNVHYRECDTTYEQWLDDKIESGAVSTRGLKEGANLFGELVFDVNTEYFDARGGYEYAKSFFEEAYHYAEKKVGSEYIVSAVMHADEVHRGILDETGREVYHYHLHVIYVPVVEKEIKWTKRCKDPTLVGTVKEVINQISNSKKWAFVPAIDENGNKVIGKNGKAVLIPSYSILQTEFFEHMKAAGYKDFERGEMGSDAEHLSVIEFKTKQSKERLEGVKNQLTEKEETLETLTAKVDSFEKIEARADEIHRMGRQNDKGLVEMPWGSFDKLTNLAREGLYSRKKIETLKSQITDLQGRFDLVYGKLKELFEETKLYRACMKIMPDAMKKLMGQIVERHKTKAEMMMYQPLPPLFGATKNRQNDIIRRDRGRAR